MLYLHKVVLCLYTHKPLKTLVKPINSNITNQTVNQKVTKSLSMKDNLKTEVRLIED